jgi:hypothetical protein
VVRYNNALKGKKKDFRKTSREVKNYGSKAVDWLKDFRKISMCLFFAFLDSVGLKSCGLASSTNPDNQSVTVGRFHYLSVFYYFSSVTKTIPDAHSTCQCVCVFCPCSRRPIPSICAGSKNGPVKYESMFCVLGVCC